MRISINPLNNKKTIRWCLGVLLCTCVASCSSDSVINDVDEPQSQVPMQFSQTIENEPVTRAASPLKEGFLVSCWKAADKTQAQEVMGNYEVKYKFDGWNNQSKWEYVGTTAEGYYKNQVQRYWDTSSFPYRFYAITPCPAATDIANFVMTNTRLAMPASAVYEYQTCNNGIVSSGAEPYSLAQAEYKAVAQYVALPFYHLTWTRTSPRSSPPLF